MPAARDDIAMMIDERFPPHVPAPELTSCPASELITPHWHLETWEDKHGRVWFNAMSIEYGDLYRAGTFELWWTIVGVT